MTRGTLCVLAALLLAPAPALQAREPSAAERALVASARAGDVAQIRAALDAGVPVEARDRPGGFTPLMAAADNGHGTAVDLLLARGAAVNATAEDGWSALMQASYNGHASVVRRLLAAGADVKAREARFGNTALLLAARSAAPAVAAALLDAGASVEERDLKDGNTPLIQAAGTRKDGAGDTLALLLARGADPNAAAKDGYTALMAAVQRGNAAAAERLLAAGAGADAATRDGRTPLLLAAELDDAALVARLLAAGARPAARSADGSTALGAAAMRDARGAVRELARAGADLNAPGALGLPPLAAAARAGRAAMVTELLALGADPNARGVEDGTTALMWAANRGLKTAVEALLAAGARADPVAKDGWTALAAAQMAGYDDIAALIAAAR